MNGLPPPPEGFRPDPTETLKAWGVTITNGFRTPADTKRLQSQGYTAAPGGVHEDADGLDIVPGKSGLSLKQLQAKAQRELAASWPGATAEIHNGTHVHMKFPGWGQAPGMPAPPKGFAPVDEMDETEQRIATLDMGLARGDMTPEQHRQFVAEVKSGRSLADRPADLVDAGGVVLFRDEQPETPATKLSKEDEAAFLEFVRRGDIGDARRFRESKGVFGTDNLESEVLPALQKGARLPNAVNYNLPDAIQSDGAAGAFARGVGDPFNVLDEMGAVVDTVGLTPGRENIWNTDRGFLNALYSNIDLNRAVLKADDEQHWKARLGGQLLTSVALPIGLAARTPAQLARVGATEGAAAGFGAGEGNPLQRAPNALLGAGVGAGGGFAIGKGIEFGAPAAKRLFAAVRPSAREAAFEAAPLVNDATQSAGPTPAAKTQPQGGVVSASDDVQAMASDIDVPTLTGPRERDYIDVDNLPPPPAGFTPEGPPLTALRQFRPENVRPIPGNRLTGPDELQSSLQPVEVPRPGRVPKKPAGFVDALKSMVRNQSAEKGLPVRIDAEDAIDKGVPAELIYVNPNEADKAKLRLRMPSVFGTRYGKMSDTRQVLRSLDMDDVDPAAWGFDAKVGGRLDPEEIGDLIRRDLEGDPTALERGAEFDEWMDYQRRLDEQAEFEGRFPDGPPLERVGRPVTEEDLAAMVPPDSAYEDAPRLVAKVGNLNLERVDDPEQVSRLIQHITANVPELAKARGGRLSNDELKLAARDLGVKPKDILAWNKGKGLPTPAELFAWRVIIHQGRQKVAALAKRTKGASDADLAKFHNTVMKQVALERQLAGAAAESGRLLQQFNAIAAAGDMTDQAIKAYLRGAGGRETVEEMGEAIIDLVKDPKGTGKFLKSAARVRNRDMVNELWVNALLSGVGTHLVNFGGNGLVALLTLPEEALTAGIGRVLRSEDRVHLRDVGARAVGMVQGAREGLRLARVAFRTGEPSDGVSKVEARNYQSIPGKVGHILRTPTRALTAADEFWGAMHYQGAVAAGAMRRALNEGGGREKVMARFEALRAAPDGDLIKFGRSEALYRTFRKPLGKSGRSVQQFSNETPGAKLVIPFVRTPINIIKYAGERSPLSPIAKPFWNDIQAGGRTRDEAIGRLMMGAGLSMWALDAALNGRISGGGPTDPKEKAALRNSGWQHYSIKIGDTWVSYQRFEPLSLIMGATADFAELGTWATGKEADEVALGISMAVAKNITSKTWVSGLSDFFEVLSDPERYGKTWVQRMAGTAAAPPIIGNAARASDPDVRHVNSVLDAIKNRVPVLSRDLEARRDVWGEPIKRGSGAGQGPVAGTLNYINPVYYSRESRDPLRREVARLRAPLSMPQRFLRIGKENRKLTPEQYGAYVELSGKPAKQYLDEFIKTREWRAMGDDERREHLKETLTEFRDIARGELKRRYPELDEEVPPPPPPGFVPVQ